VSKITQRELKELLSYDPDTGDFVWSVRPKDMFSLDRLCKRWNTRHAGKVAGSVYLGSTTGGYCHIKINARNYAAHRLAWLYVHGKWPNQIDHINHKRDDNRIVNLRDVTQKENCRNASMYSNNKSGMMGVRYQNSSSKWVAEIIVDGREVRLGLFGEISDAKAARMEANIKYGFHKNHGKAA